MVTTDSTWETLYGKPKSLQISGKKIKVVVPAISTVVLKANKKFIATTPLKVDLAKIEYDFATPNWLSLRATVPGDEFVEVNFQIRKKGAAQWSNVGTADRRTFETSDVAGGLYRTFLQPRKFPSGTTIEVVAIAKNQAGDIAYSKIRTFQIKY